MTQERIIETFSVSYLAGPRRDLTKTARTLRRLGARRSSDALILSRDDRVEAWQSDSFGDLVFLLGGQEQYLGDVSWDELRLEYPLTAVPEIYAAKFVAFAQLCSETLSLPMLLEGREVAADELQERLLAALRLLREQYFEPGSIELRWSVESQHGN